MQASRAPVQASGCCPGCDVSLQHRAGRAGLSFLALRTSTKLPAPSSPPSTLSCRGSRRAPSARGSSPASRRGRHHGSHQHPHRALRRVVHISARLAFAIAHAHGHDAFCPAACTAVLACLTGNDTEDHASASAEATATDGADAAAPASCALWWSPHRAAGPGGLSCAARRRARGRGACRRRRRQRRRRPSRGRRGRRGGRSALPAYALLGLERSASEGAVRAAYRRRALRLHPDRFPNATQAEREAATRRFQALLRARMRRYRTRRYTRGVRCRLGRGRHVASRRARLGGGGEHVRAQAMDVAGASLAGLHQAAGGDLATHAIGRVVTSGGVAVAGAVAHTELQVLPLP